MEEKYMVNDILENIKSEILIFTNSIINCENPEIKQVLESLRSTLEAFYSELFLLATSKGYYFPTQTAKPEEISRHKKAIYIKLK